MLLKREYEPQYIFVDRSEDLVYEDSRGFTLSMTALKFLMHHNILAKLLLENMLTRSLWDLIFYFLLCIKIISMII